MLEARRLKVLMGAALSFAIGGAAIGLAAGQVLPNSSFVSFGAAMLGLIALLGIRWTDQVLDQFDHIRLGRDGEIAVAQCLSRLERDADARVFHDVDTGRCFIDHVLVHSSGVYAIETKTRSRKHRGDNKLRYDGASVLKGRCKFDERAPKQAKRQAAQLREFLLEEELTASFVAPVLLFPGWSVRDESQQKDPLWIGCPKGFVASFQTKESRLSVDQKAAIIRALVKRQRAPAPA